MLLMAQPPAPSFEDLEIQSSRHWLDIDYVGDRFIGHRLDIHLPVEEKAQYPVVICIYGSAFFSNSSKAATFETGVGQALLEAGFAVVSINHRASTDSVFPAQIHDVRAAIRFIRANGAAFSLDTSFIAMTGWSSGGHLVSMAGTTNGMPRYELEGKTIDLEGDLGAHTDMSSSVDAVVDWFGPTGFLIMDECGSAMVHDDPKSPESTLVGGPIQDHPLETKLADPATYAHAGSSPFLIFHGDEDPLVPHCQSEHLHEELQQAGANSRLVIIPGGGHGPRVMIEQYYAEMVDFFIGVMK